MPGILHFFPGQKTMIWIVDGVVKIRAEAWGGEEPVPGMNYGTMKPRKTTPGRYVIHSLAPYRTNTWELSRIPWGTPITRSPDGDQVLYETGNMAHPWKAIPNVTRAEIEGLNYALYGKYELPDHWVFNDFGMKAVRYYRDLNHNKKLDAGEVLSGEMIHTTPRDEANTALGKEVHLEPSHGCIHIKPFDRGRLEAAGAFAKGTDFVIHTYAESLPKAFE